MRFVKTVIVSAALAAALAAAPAMAQPAQSANVIVLNMGQVVANSDIGRDMNTKLQQIATQMQGELQPEQNALQTEGQSLETATQNMTNQQVQANSALNQRVQRFGQQRQNFETHRATLARDFEYTQAMTLQDFNQQITPVVREVMTARGAGVVLDSNAIQIAEPQYDATNDVVQRLNQRLHTLNVTRRSAPPPQQQGAPAPAPAPAPAH
ncbi:MAG TPA: OmpH family outer membrane protein [Caulobacterales bacterium]|nr:OmpH family outer membrane protein [Caulobacterales bacterium]